MTYLIVFGIYFAGLAVIGMMSRRSLGAPTLALAAGALLASYWSDSLTPFVAQAGFVLVQPPLSSIVAVILTLFPALLVMIRSPKATSFLHSLLGSLVFAAFAVVLTYPAFEKAVVMDEGSRGVIGQGVIYFSVVATVCILLSVIEILVYRKKTHTEHTKKHKK